MDLDDSCNTGLVLGLGISPTPNNYNSPIKKASATVEHRLIRLDPSLTLSLSGESYKTKTVSGAGEQICGQTSSHSGISSFSSERVKREREIFHEDGEEEAEETTERVVYSRMSDDHEDEGVSARKKLRLTKQQSALLEGSFKLHSTLNPKQKQALAKQLNLRPRQVEVWFQNRRARTKLKQTEVDCEFLKKCCEALTDENKRLQKELQDLKAVKLSQPFYMHTPAATLTMCPSCERLGDGSGGVGGVGGATKSVDGDTAKGAFSVVIKPRFYNPFTNPSAAC